MKVWLYSEHKQANLGHVRFLVAAELVRPESIGKDDIDRDEDIVTKRWAFPTKDKADSFAREILKRTDLAYGCVTVQEQVVAWFVKQDKVAEWQDVGDYEVIDE